MKNLKFFAVITLFAASLTVPFVLRAADTNSVVSDQKPTPYPLKTCVVSGEKLGEMGAPIEFVYTNKAVNQEIKFCCPMCKGRFLNNPDKYMKTITDAEAAQK